MPRSPTTDAVSPTLWSQMEAHRGDLIRLARARGCTFEEAQDLSSEAFIRAATFSDLDDSRLGAFLNTVVLRMVVDLRRREATHRRIVHRLADLPCQVSHEEDVCDRHAAAQVWRRLGHLPETERAVFLARAEGHSVAQVSKQLHLSPKTVEGAYTRARKRLRRSLAGFGLVAWINRPRTRWVPATLIAVPVALVGLQHSTPPLPPPPVQSLPRFASPVSVADASNVTPSPVVVAALVPRKSPPRNVKTPERGISLRDKRPAAAVVAPGLTSYDEDETFTESLMRCLREGPVVSFERVGCPPSTLALSPGQATGVPTG